MTDKYLVHYTVLRFPDTYTAGPYKSIEEAHEHADDIRGYEGVYTVEIVQAGPKDDK